jgi:hypothetical protein
LQVNDSRAATNEQRKNSGSTSQSKSIKTVPVAAVSALLLALPAALSPQQPDELGGVVQQYHTAG